VKDPFELEWIVPLEPGLSTHVALFDSTTDPPHVFAVGHGGDEAEALLDLWTTLTDANEPDEAVAYVAAAYRRRTGEWPIRLP
jgi:hypothetical protein